MIYYAILDTNVLVSSMLNPNSVPGSVVREALTGDIDGCKKLADLNCANNSLSRLDVSGFALNSLECQHQRLRGLRRSRAFRACSVSF